MQLNVHVPKAREDLVRQLEDVARASDHTKSQLVLDAIEMYLRRRRRPLAARADLPVFEGMRLTAPWSRADIYEERIDRTLGGS